MKIAHQRRNLLLGLGVIAVIVTAITISGYKYTSPDKWGPLRTGIVDQVVPLTNNNILLDVYETSLSAHLALQVTPACTYKVGDTISYRISNSANAAGVLDAQLLNAPSGCADAGPFGPGLTPKANTATANPVSQSSALPVAKPLLNSPIAAPDLAPWLVVYAASFSAYVNQSLSKTGCCDTAADDTYPLTVTWSWGDGSVTGAIVNYYANASNTNTCSIPQCYYFSIVYDHAYTKAGSYTLVTTLTDTAGLSRSYSRPVSITDPPPPPPVVALAGGGGGRFFCA